MINALIAYFSSEIDILYVSLNVLKTTFDIGE